MEIFYGSPVLSKARGKKLLKELQLIEPAITAVTDSAIYFVDSPRRLNKQQQKQLSELLGAANAQHRSVDGAQQFIVVPRLGTISPWSSKATDIAHNAGLDYVTRVERGIVYVVSGSIADRKKVEALLYDRMTETVFRSLKDVDNVFNHHPPRALQIVDVLSGGRKTLAQANKQFGFALNDEEIDYLQEAYVELGRNPTDVELMMFGVVNSEHCRHKIFNADWLVNDKKQPKSLFKMIKNTYEKSSNGTLSAYADNAAVLAGPKVSQFQPDSSTQQYKHKTLNDHMVIKVESHNHPTAIAPFPGAATGTGGEIRDEAATGCGARSKMGMAGYSVSNLRIPELHQPWEDPVSKPASIASPLDIMIEAPLGAAAFANEFGRPNLLGYFRSFEQLVGDEVRGYHKPIMLAGGAGTISQANLEKKPLEPGMKLVVLGGPAMLIGLGGGAASSMQTGESSEQLDFASVQRDNAEMERRAQEVISALARLEEKNPVVSIHDVGAGGLSNAFPELVHDAGLGAHFELRDIPSADNSLSPMEIWCSEAQERYVLAIKEADLPQLQALCERERCPFAVVGEATKKPQLILSDRLAGNNPVDIPMEVLFGKPPKMTRSFDTTLPKAEALDLRGVSVAEAAKRVLQVPAVGSKKFLITIGDRNVGGLTTRDQMIGPWQVPISDVAVTAGSFKNTSGQAMSIGERPPLALIDAAAAARMSVGEALTNILAADITNLPNVKLSANWMAAAGWQDEDEKLYTAVKALGEEFCPELGVTIPVGKDSLSMRTKWQAKNHEKSVTSPLSLVVTAFSPVSDTNSTLTPLLQTNEKTSLLYVDLGQGKNRLGGSALAQVYSQVGSDAPDVSASLLKSFWEAISLLKQQHKILAYHDRSDGGLFTTLVEMAIAARVGLSIQLQDLPGSDLEKLFNEELGVVLQVKADDTAVILEQLEAACPQTVYNIGALDDTEQISFYEGKKLVYQRRRAQLEQWWSKTSYEIQKLRDNPTLAEQEHHLITDIDYTGLFAHNTPKLRIKTFRTRPKIAIFRDEGVNGQVEMAAAFHEAGFTAVDVHLNDIKQNPRLLEEFSGLVACGGFSYGDVLGAGEGWAKTILLNPELRQAFQNFFERPNTFSFGVCNGCQMLSHLKELIPGAELWPTFTKNASERFEARWVMTEIMESPSILFKGMGGSFLPLPVAHGEGHAQFATPDSTAAVSKLAAVRYVDSQRQPTTHYPLNPNGSKDGLTAFTTPDGRATIMMPHPERAFLTKQFSWQPNWNYEEFSPWFRLFQNARHWVDEQQK